MALERMMELVRRLRTELGKVIVGQEALLDEVIVALLAGGHVLLEGPPGTAKTLLVRALVFVHGPVFCVLLLEDEVNRAPA